MKKNTAKTVNATVEEKTQVSQTNHPFEGLVNADNRLAKAKIAASINKLIKKEKLTQKAAAKLLCITQPEVSNLNKGRLSGFTFDRLYRCLNILNMDVTIIVKPSRRRKNPIGHVTVSPA